MAWLALIFLILVCVKLFQIRSLVLQTSLYQAWIWLCISVAGLGVTVFVQILHSRLRPGWPDATEWFASVLLMAPPIAVLGARRPGSRAWPWFVVLPLVVVLLWPAGSELYSSYGNDRLTVSTPALLGFLIAGLMGFGNYFGTQNTLSAILYFASPAILLLNVASSETRFLGTSFFSLLGLWGALLLGVRRYHALQAVKRTSPEQAANRLWWMFRDFLGIVWAKRVMDRMNLFARREHWRVELTLDGFVSKAGESLTPDDFRRPIETLAWLLRRFADEDWVGQQLEPFSFRSQSETVDV